jgi:hypothetical protein
MEGEFIKIFKKFVYADGFHCLFDEKYMADGS